MITPVMQHYLMEIYRLQERAGAVSPSALADHLEVSVQAVSRMIRQLREKGLVKHEPYQGVQLLPEGERWALRSIRRHRLIEVFLVRVMGFGWHEVHALSDIFEEGINDVLEDRMDEVAGHPTRCPHGEPIPTRDGVMPALADTSLIGLNPGAVGEISRVRTEDSEKLRYLGELGLVPGVTLHLHARAPFNGPLRVLADHQEHVLGHELAAAIWITPHHQT
jgi:DtxR family Mn-dependent transcriptional regulator